MKLDSRFEHDFSHIPTHGSHGTAESLPFLDRIQSSFGRFDVSGVHAHMGSTAAASMGVNAFTTGDVVEFARTPTLRTAAHEATHVMQQRAGVPFSGRGQPGDPFERQADAVAERVVQGRSSESLLPAMPYGIPLRSGTAIQFDKPTTQPTTQPTTRPTTQPTAQPAAAQPPLRYHTGWFTTLTAPASSVTETWLEGRLKKIFATYTVTGIPATAPKETRLFLLYLLDEVSGKENWGAEMDLLAPVAWPAKKGDPPVVGRVTVRIDHLGNAVAEYIDKGLPAAPQTTLAAATVALKPFGFESIRDDGTATWKDAEISDVVEALKLLPPDFKDELKGVELIRVKQIDGGAASGQFSVGGTTGPNDTSIIKPSLKLPDEAFTPELRFSGGTKGTVPASYQTILHEVGHAVEKQKYRQTAEVFNKAATKSNKLAIPVRESFDQHKKLSTDYAKLYKQWEDAKKAGDKKKEGDLTPKLLDLKKKIDAALTKNVEANKKLQPARDTAEDANKKMKAMLVDPKTVVKPLEAEAAAKKPLAQDAVQKIASVRSLLNAALIKSSQAYMDEIDKTSKAIETFAAASKDQDITALEKPVLTQIEARDKEGKKLAAAVPGHSALTSMNFAAAAQDEWFSAERTAARAPTRTLRVQKFVELVTANKIEPITNYAKKNWPHLPSEFYAESYALWRTDPEFLQNRYKPIYDFFQSGDYRK